MKVNKKLSNVISDFLINLSAGWIGALFVVPIFSDTSIFVGWYVLTGDLVMGILFLYIAYKLRK